jgi:single-stranded DNA-binding protein
MHLDMNLVVLCGHLAADPETRQLDGGSRLVRYLVTVRVDHPRRRVDVVPVAYWDPPDDIWDDPGSRDIRVWVVGAVQRRFWEAPDGRRSASRWWRNRSTSTTWATGSRWRSVGKGTPAPNVTAP